MFRCVDVRTELAPRVKVVAESRSRTAVTTAHGQLGRGGLAKIGTHGGRVDAQSRRTATSFGADGEHAGLVRLHTSTSHNTRRVSESPVVGAVGCLTDNTRATRTTGAERRSRTPDTASSRWGQMGDVHAGVGDDRWDARLSRLDPVVDTSSDTVRTKITDVVKIRIKLRAHGLLKSVLGDARLRQLLVHASNLSLSRLELLLEAHHLSQISLRNVVELRASARSVGERVGESTRARRVWRRLTTTLSVKGSALLAQKDLLLVQLGQEFVEVRVAGRKSLRTTTKAEAVGGHGHGGHSDLTLLMEKQVSKLS
jgi:hypothetical protein